jgi:vacuolar-type H+-ATPase subunit H
MDRKQIQALGKKLPRGLLPKGRGGQGAFLALHENNDPFMVGTPTHRAMARWFKALWDEFGYVRGKHVRDIHYDIATRLEYTYYKHDGTPYVHTKTSYDYMQAAARYARHLGLMGEELGDKRSDPIKPFATQRSEYFDGSRSPDFEAEFDEDEWEMPEIRIDEPPAFPFPEAGASGYDYHPSDQPVHVEVWVEKTKAEPQLESVCRRHHANLQWGDGTFGIEVCRDFVGRVRVWEKPARLVYLCDYDPAGIQMPVSVGRQVEFILNEAGEHDLDITVEVLAVTTEQITALKLPRKPFEEQKHLWAQTRAHNFEKHLGEGGTELNAMADTKLASIVEERILKYRDDGLRDAVGKAGEEAQEALDEAIEEARDEFRDGLEGLREEVREVVERYRPLVEKLNRRMTRELESALRRREGLRERIQDELDDLDADLPDYPEGEVIGPLEDEHYLFDSSRTYLEQMRQYRRRQGREREWDIVLAAIEDRLHDDERLAREDS